MVSLLLIIGFKQAPCVWHETLAVCLMSIMYRKGDVHPFMYILWGSNGNPIAYLVLYVNEFLLHLLEVCGSNQVLLSQHFRAEDPGDA